MRIDDDTAIAAYVSTRQLGGANALFEIPAHMRGAFARWVMWGIAPGQFLTAVISNELAEAATRADDENARRLFEWVRLFYSRSPAASWGSPDAFKHWHERGGLLGRCGDCGVELDVPGHPGTTRVGEACFNCKSEMEKQNA